MFLRKNLSFFLCLVTYLSSSIHSSNGQMSSASLWKGATIPYVIDPILAKERPTILAAMNEISKSTCVKFVPRAGQLRYLNIKSSTKCETVVGSIRGGTPLSLSDKCVCKGIIMHGLYHAVGVAKAGDIGPSHGDQFPCSPLTYSISSSSLCSKTTLNQVEINNIKRIYKC